MFLPAFTQASMLARTQCGVGEVDDGVDGFEGFSGVSAAQAGIFFRADDTDVMLALGGDFRHQRSGFAAA